MPMPNYNGPMYNQGPTAVGPYNIQGYQPSVGYNPQQTYIPQTQQPQMAVQQPQTPSLVGRVVTANDQIPPAEIPSNGTPAYFPMQDGSAILVKVWNGNGTINTIRYVPEPAQPSQQPQDNSIQSVARDITENQNANYRALHDELVQYRIEDKNDTIAELRSQVQALNLAASQSNQNTYLIDKLQPCPTPAYVVPNPNAYYNGCYQNCGYSNGCGC